MKIIVITTISFMIQLSAYGSCSEQIGSCDYYLCREELNPCGESGYYKAFGYYYCSKSFDELSDRVKPQTQNWLTEVAACLQIEMERSIPIGSDCREVKDQAIESHYNCYRDTNFCKLPVKDMFKVIRMLSPELKNPKMLSLGIRILKNCAH